MSWQDDEIAGPMGYKHCVLFDCARDAISAFQLYTLEPLSLPENICPELVAYLQRKGQQITWNEKSAVHLYGYQGSHLPSSLSLDPLMTGWVRHLKTPSSIVSFGPKKMLSVGYGGAFLTDDWPLALQMSVHERWNTRYTQPILKALDGFVELIERQREAVALWDRYLGDSLIRISAEQLMPWRAMRRARNKGERDVIVEAVRKVRYPVGTNYPPLTGRNEWGDTVLNFFLNLERREIFEISEIVKQVVDNG